MALTFTDVEIAELDLFVNCHWCGSDGVVLVLRTSVLSGDRYGDPACNQCADQWRKGR